jgi:hypothetical protein
MHPAPSLAPTEMSFLVRMKFGTWVKPCRVTGSAQHVGGLLFQKLTGTRFGFVPYPCRNCAREISGPMPRPPRVGSQLRRISRLDEAGLPGFYLGSWSGMWAPKRTPRDVIAKLNAAVLDTLADSTVRQRLAEIGQEIFPREQQTPELVAEHGNGREVGSERQLVRGEHTSPDVGTHSRARIPVNRRSAGNPPCGARSG